MLGATETDAFGAERAREARLLGPVGVRPHAEPPGLVRPGHEPPELGTAHGWRAERNLAPENLTGGTVDRQERPGRNGRGFSARSRDRHLLVRVVDEQRPATRHAGFAHLPRDDRRVRGHAAARREEPLRGLHAANVLGRSFDADQ